jgi:hypothetical protein
LYLEWFEEALAAAPHERADAGETGLFDLLDEEERSSGLTLRAKALRSLNSIQP